MVLLKSKVKATQRKELFLLSLIVILLGIILITSLVYLRASQPVRLAEKEVTRLAKKYGKIEDVQDFYMYTRQSTSYAVVGTDADGKIKIAIVPKTGEKMIVFNQNEGISEAQMLAQIAQTYPDEIVKKVVLGYEENQAIWEVVTKKDNHRVYRTFAFKDGTEIKTIDEI